MTKATSSIVICDLDGPSLDVSEPLSGQFDFGDDDGIFDEFPDIDSGEFWPIESLFGPWKPSVAHGILL